MSQPIDFSNVDSIKIQSEPKTYSVDGDIVAIEDNIDICDANFNRDGVDLQLNFDDGGQIVIEGYFSELTAPTLQGSNGASLSAELVQSFTKSEPTYDVAQQYAMNDVSPVGSIDEIVGQSTVTRVDGSVEAAQIGTQIYQGDIVETDASGAVNIVFVDETSFAVSGDSKLAIDEYVFDPASESGTTNFSVLKGMFVFTSGLIGRDDPDDVMIDTPMGSIGIRGTIIAGDVDSGEITVIEGAIVLRDFNGNEMTLADQFATARFEPNEGTIDAMGQLSASDVAGKFDSVSGVAPDLFSSIEDAANESVEPEETQAEEAEASIEEVDAVEEGDAVTGEEAPHDSERQMELKDGEDLAAEETEKMEVMLDKAETLLMEDGMDEALLGDDGQLDGHELMEILTNDSAAREAMKAQMEIAGEEATKDGRMAEGTLSAPAHDEPQFIPLAEQVVTGPEIIHIPDGVTGLNAPHDDVVLIGNAGFNVLGDFDVSNKNVSMQGRAGSDQFQVVVDDSGNKQTGVLNGGDGNDTLTIISSGASGTLDFSNVAALKNIEIIDLLSSSGQETIVLTPDKIFSSVGIGGTLTIDGNSSDTVQIDFGGDTDWANVGDTNTDGYTEYEYTSGATTTTLLIDNDVVASSGLNITGI